MLEFVLPTEFKITDKVIISKQSGWKFTCPIIEYNDENYTLSSINEQDNPFIQIHSILDKPLSLYTSGDMEIHSLITEPILSTDENVNIKCHEIIADNALTLYRSPLPNLYEMKECGEIDNFYYGYWGYDSNSAEFEALIDGQEFHFADNAFGTSFTLTKQGSQWIGNHVCYNYNGKFDKYNHNNKTEIGWIYLASSEFNQYLLKLAGWTTGNPLQLAYEAKTLTFNCKNMTNISFGETDGNGI